jgi:hypothetical protein
MGLSHSPSIVTDGLDFYVDPNNTRCYPGFGNTVYNIVNSSIGATLVGFTSALLDNTEARSFYFDGTNDSLPFSNSSSYSPTKITVCIWFKKAHGSSFKALIDKGRDLYGGWTLCADETANKVTFKARIFYTSAVSGAIVTSSNYNSNAWNFVCGVYDGAYLSIYLNGALSNSAYYLQDVGSNSYPVTIGAANDGYNVNANIGQAFIYGRALSAAEINQNYHATKKKYLIEENIVTNGLVLNLDPSNPNSYSGSGNKIFDISGSGQTGTLTNGPTFTSLNNGYINFDGTNDYIDFPRSNLYDFGSSDFTIMYWINTTTKDRYNAVIDLNDAGGKMIIGTQINTGNSWMWFTSSYNIAGTINMCDGAWHLASISRIGSTLTHYVDGRVSVSTNVGSTVVPFNNFFSIGILFQTGDYGQIKLADVKIYKNKGLTQQEIKQNYNATKGRFVNALPAVRNGLVLELDALSYSGSGNTWYDLSGNSLNGTLLNGASYSGSGTSSSFVFDGVNDRIDFGTVPANTTGRSTVGCWAKTTTTAQCMTVTFESYGSIYINRFTTGKILAFFDGSTGNNSSADVSVTSVNDGKWHYLTATNNGTTCSMYIDGVLDKTYSETPSYTTGVYNQISGQVDGFNHMNGSIGFAHIYNRALSAYEIKQNFDFYRTRYGI